MHNLSQLGYIPSARVKSLLQPYLTQTILLIDLQNAVIRVCTKIYQLILSVKHNIVIIKKDSALYHKNEVISTAFEFHLLINSGFQDELALECCHRCGNHESFESP